MPHRFEQHGVPAEPGALILVGPQPRSGDLRLIVAYVTFGISFGLLHTPTANAAMPGTPRWQAGRARSATAFSSARAAA